MGAYMKKILISILLLSGVLLTGCGGKDQPIDTSDELKESSERVSAADFVEYSVLRGAIEFGEYDFDISSNKEEVVIYIEGDLSLEDLINNLIDLNGIDTTEWENNLEELVSLTKMIKMELVDNEYSQDCVLRMFTKGKMVVEAVNGRLKIDEISEPYYIKVEELEKQSDEELHQDMLETADAKYQVALRSEEIFNNLATGRLDDAYSSGYYVPTLGMTIYLKGSATDYTVEDYNLLDMIAETVCDEFGDYHMEFEYEDGGSGEWDSALMSVFDKNGVEIWYNNFG